VSVRKRKKKKVSQEKLSEKEKKNGRHTQSKVKAFLLSLSFSSL